MNECSNRIDTNPTHTPQLSMKKTRSVDFNRQYCKAMLSGSIHHEANSVASQYSVRAARGSYCQKPVRKKEEMKSLYDDELQCGKSCRDYETSCLSNVDPLSSENSYSDDAWDSEEDVEETNESFLKQINFANFSLAKLSVIILALATVTDMAVSRMSPDNSRPRSSLGSAAISSVTEKLSPILPFTGGLDLRRDDYWTSSGNWFETLQSVATQVQDAFSGSEDMTVFKETSSNNGKRETKTSVKNVPQVVKGNYVMAVSANDPFVKVNDIAELTLGEVSEIFRFTVDSTRESFNKKSFDKAMEPRLKKVVNAMEVAIDRSRGKGVKECLTPSKSTSSGEVDALRFSGAMRVLAEWRIRRQVPDGYKGYAVGMNLGYKDIVQNLAKIERAAHVWLDHQRIVTKGEICSPTLRQILELEAEMNIHDKLPRLKDPSGAMGLLWVRRQLNYQTRLFENVLVVPKQFTTTKDAVAMAYKQVYDRYHGWAVQKIFNYSFQSAPEAELIFKQMNPHKLNELKSSQSVMDSVTESEVKSDDKRRGKEKPIDAVVKKVHKEWDKLASNTIRIFKKDHLSKLEIMEIGMQQQAGTSSSSFNEDFIVQEMVKDAHEHIESYLEDVNPLLDDLANLFDELNMDDPTKV